MSGFRIIFEGINLLLTVGSFALSEGLNAKLKSLQADIDQLQRDLAKVGIDLKSGSEFFQKVVEKVKDINLDSSILEAITNKKIIPAVETIAYESRSIFNELKLVPDPTVTSSSDKAQEALIWITRVLTLTGCVFSASRFGYSLRAYFKNKKFLELHKNSPEETLAFVDPNSLKEEQDKIEKSSQIELEETGLPRKIGVNNVPETPKAIENLSTGMDAVLFILAVVSIVQAAVSFASDKDQLEKTIDELKGKVSEAKERAKTLTAEEAQFFRDVPSFFLAIQSQLTRILQIATIAKAVEIPNSTNLQPLFEKVGKFHPWTLQDYNDMNNFVAQLDQAEQETDKDEKIKKMQAIFAKINEDPRFTNDKFVEAFTQVPLLYNDLNTILKAAFESFNAVSNMISAIKTVRILVTEEPPTPFKILSDTVKSIMGPTSDNEVLHIIAVFTTFPEDTYPPSYDLKTIRDSYTAIDRQTWNNYVDQCIRQRDQENPQ